MKKWAWVALILLFTPVTADAERAFVMWSKLKTYPPTGQQIDEGWAPLETFERASECRDYVTYTLVEMRKRFNLGENAISGNMIVFKAGNPPYTFVRELVCLPDTLKPSR